MSSRTSRRVSSAWRSAPAWWACGICALLVLLSPAPLVARQLSESEVTQLLESLATADRLLSELEVILPTLRENSDALSGKLLQAQQRLSELESSLQLWQERSAALESSLVVSQVELDRLKNSLEELEKRYSGLYVSWQEYRQKTQSDAMARELAVRRWRTVAIAGMVGALAGGFLAGALAR